ncbi:MAG: sulfate ABC transporter substrate-binding protein [Planctomycetia bacterium]|nr:sulfate ABC transporter substrate-binding protein [Planctomycetia bacterium]
MVAAVWVIASGFTSETGLLNVACDPTRELWRELNEQFQTRRGVKVRMSHGGSSSQARSVIDGLAADVVSLALWSDTDAIRRVGLIDEGWEDRLPDRSLAYTSTIVFVVRKGNPKNIHDWPDLARPGVAVITPNPKTSGNGKWSFLAAFGSVLVRGGDETHAEEFVTRLIRNAPVMDTAARAATMTFSQKGIGDVHLTWENEAHLEVEENPDLIIVYPPVSVLAEPHVAAVDAINRRRGNEAIVRAYLEYLYTDEAQDIIARHHHRPTRPSAWERHKDKFPSVEMFRVTRIAPDWDELQRRFFAEGALFDRIITGGRGR